MSTQSRKSSESLASVVLAKMVGSKAFMDHAKAQLGARHALHALLCLLSRYLLYFSAEEVEKKVTNDWQKALLGAAKQVCHLGVPDCTHL